MQSGSQAENDAGEHRSADSEKQNAPANRDVVKARQGIGHELQEKILGAEENRYAGYPAKKGKNQALGQQLPGQPGPRGSEGLAQSHFASSRAGARELKICDVYAADQQHQPHRAKEKKQLA